MSFYQIFKLMRQFTKRTIDDMHYIELRLHEITPYLLDADKWKTKDLAEVAREVYFRARNFDDILENAIETFEAEAKLKKGDDSNDVHNKVQ